MFYSFNLKKYRALIVAICLLICGVLFAIVLVNKVYPIKYIDLVEKYAAENDLDVSFVCGVIYTESKFKAQAKSNKGASGLMQLTEQTAVWLAGKMKLENFTYDDIFDPETNISIGCYNLRRLLNLYDGDEKRALAAYNAGEGNVAKWLKINEHSADGQTLVSIPYKETEQFVKRVNFNKNVYSKLLYFYKAKVGGTNENK